MDIPFTKFDGLYINGQWSAPSGGNFEPIINPANEEIIGQSPVGALADAEDAIAAAREAFDTSDWPSLPMQVRAEYMRKMLDAIGAKAEQIKQVMIAEGGITRQLAEGMFFPGPIRLVEKLIERSLCVSDKHLPVETALNPLNPAGPELLGGGVVVRDPIGVVSAISPYNAPFLVNLSKIAPALLAGNTVILKPSPYTPFSALLFGEIADDIGLPAGVLNIITGDEHVSKMITSDPRVDMVTFTGSETVGALIMAQAAPTLKKVLLELGGKSALIVREDADVMQAAMTGVFNLSNHCGQGCALATRHLVHNKIRPQYIEAMKMVAPQLPLGDPADPTTVVGPLIRKAALDRVQNYVQIAKDEGAKLVIGGDRASQFDKGFYHNITVFDDVDNSMRVAQEEIFGPVGAVIGFDTDEEAIKIANDSRYGLYGGIESADSAKAFHMAKQLRTGGVVINGGLMRQNDAPFGGYKRSGLGREYGPNWLDEYTEEKSIIFRIGS